MAADLLNDWIGLVETPQDLFPSVVSAKLKTIGGKRNGKQRQSLLYHTQSLTPQSSVEEDEGRNPYLEQFRDAFSKTDDLSAAGLLSWIDEIGDERVVKKLRSLSEDDLLLLTLYFYLELTQAQIAPLLGITRRAVSKRLSALLKKF